METRILNDVAVYGAIIMSKNEDGFPQNPRIGTLVIKDNTLYVYIQIGGLETWYPYGNRTQSYVHVQGLPSTTWEVEHNLGTGDVWYQIQDADGEIVQAKVTKTDQNNLQVTFTTPITGTIVIVAPTSIDVPEVKATSIQAGNGYVVIDNSGIRIDGDYVLTAGNIEFYAEQAVTAEATSRSNADTTLQSNINTELTARTNAVTTLQNNINTEITARTNADTTLQANITAVDNKVNALGSAFNYVGTVSGGTQPAPFDLNTLDASGKNPGDYYKVAVSGYFVVGAGSVFLANANDGLVWNNASSVDIIDNTNSSVSGTSDFVTVTGSADAGFVIDVASTFKTRVTSAESDILVEKTARTNADTTLQSNINAELTSRTSADTTLQSNINVEIAARTNADTTLQSNIDTKQPLLAHAVVTSATSTTSATTSNQVVDISATTLIRSAKYNIQVTSGSSYHTTEVSIVHDGSEVFISEYGTIITGSSLATFSADISSGSMRLLVTPTNAVTTIKVVKTAINV